MGESYGYIRVSTKEQNLGRQYQAVKQYVNDDDKIYSDKASGKDMERDGFKHMLKPMKRGDTLYIKSIDRLGRNKLQIKEHLEQFKRKGIRVKIIDMPTTMHDIPEGNEWAIDMINNIMIEVYTSIAEQERDTILQRQREGIDNAQAEGRHLGRPPMELPGQWDALYKQWKAGHIKAVEFMDKVNMKKSTFYKKVKEYEADKIS